jgi:hypothetical protein
MLGPCPSLAASRRPGRSKKLSRASFIVRDANKQALAFVYCEDYPPQKARRHRALLMVRSMIG